MRGWAFNFELGSHSHRCWKVGATYNWTGHVGSHDWANPLFDPSREQPDPVRWEHRSATGSTCAKTWVDLQWLRYVDDQGYDHWPVIPGWEISWTNPFIGYPYFTYQGRDYVLRSSYSGYSLNHVPLPRYDGAQLPASFHIRRLDDSADYKEILIIID